MVRTSPSFWLMAVILVFVSSSADAAVRRRVTIRSTPPGALVYIDDQEIGVTPVSTSFTYYGTRKVQLVKDGYETVTVLRTFKPPWYQLPIIDFVTENLDFVVENTCLVVENTDFVVENLDSVVQQPPQKSAPPKIVRGLISNICVFYSKTTGSWTSRNSSKFC